MSSSLRLAAGVCVIALYLLGGTLGLAQQDALTFNPENWGLTSAADIRYGQVAEILEPGGRRLVVYQVSAKWTPPPVAGGAVTRGTTPPRQNGRLVVSSFDAGNRNALGGVFNTFVRPPVEGSAAIASAPDGVRGLRIECSGVAGGFCGTWVHLFDSRQAPADRHYFDTRPFSALAFRVWSSGPGDDVVVKAADAAWEAREDALPVGRLSEFAATGRLSPGWTEAIVPLSRLDRALDRSKLASVLFESLSPAPVRLFVRDLTFVESRGVALAPLPAAAAAVAAASSRKLDRAVWVWHTDELLADSGQSTETIRFLRAQGVGTVFLQLPKARGGEPRLGEITIDAARFAPLVAAFSAASMRVYALDGAPELALPSSHEGVVQTVRNVVAYNAAVSESERFVGVRYDIEPYLLPGFHGPRRTRILADLLTLTARIAEEAHAAGLRVGFDLPFWYDAPAERTFQNVSLEWRGRTQPASHHLIDLVDDVSAMAYRTVAYGADGTINHAEDELRYAAAHGRSVYVGLETYPLPNERLLEFWGEPTTGMPVAASAVDRVVIGATSDGARVVVVPAGADPRAFGATLATNPATGPVLWWPVRRTINVPASKSTFAGFDVARLHSVMEQTAFEFSAYPSFAGFSIHDVRSWRALIEASARANR